MDLSILAGGAGTLCVVVGGAFAFVLFLFVVWRLTRSTEPAGVAALKAALPPGFDIDGAPLSAIPDPVARRDALLDRIETGLGYLGAELEVVKGSKLDLRVRGQFRGRPAAFEIDRDGRVTRLSADGPFAPGAATLPAHGEPIDPDGALARVNDYELQSLVEQLQEAQITALHFAPDAVRADCQAQLHELELFEELQVVGQMLSAMENAVGLWLERADSVDAVEAVEEEPEDETPTEPPAPSPLSNPVHARVAQAMSWDPWEDDEPEALHREACALLFDAIQDTLTRPKQLLPDEDRSEAELRGRVGEVPVRLKIESDGEWSLEAKVGETSGVYLRYDPDLEPVEADAEDDFAEEDDIRVFVTKGLYMETTPDVIELYMPFIERAEPAQLDQLRDAMARLQLSFVWFLNEELEVGGKVPCQQLDDPVAVFREVLEVVGWMGTVFPEQTESKGSLSRVRCQYCGGHYFFGIRREACPNCGAPPGA